MNLKPLEDRVIVKTVESQDVTASGIVLPDSARRNRSVARSSRWVKASSTITASAFPWM